jgi:hypothetical protein
MSATHDFTAHAVDPDGTLASNSDSCLPTQKAVKTYVDAHAGGTLPIGFVFVSVVTTNPNTLLGYGTWEAMGAGKVLIGVDPADSNYDAAEKTAGAKTSTPDAHA